jgi:hypothetical protein
VGTFGVGKRASGAGIRDSNGGFDRTSVKDILSPSEGVIAAVCHIAIQFPPKASLSSVSVVARTQRQNVLLGLGSGSKLRPHVTWLKCVAGRNIVWCKGRFVVRVLA